MTAPLTFALLGNPVAHSKSPRMHAAAYRALHLPHRYLAIRAEVAELGGLVTSLRDGEYAGFNVTVPHKQNILAHVDEVAESARLAGAANTLVRTREGRIVAHNTDVAALAHEIRVLATEVSSWLGSRALVLGTGGAARSAVLALASHLEVAEIVVRARRPAGFAEAMAPLLQASGAKARLRVEALAPNPADEATFAVVVQGTSAGMDGAEPGDAVAAAVAWEALAPRAVALDVVYAPPVTPFLRSAEAHGVRSANGLGMLARQGALALTLWLGVPAPYNAMLAALLDEKRPEPRDP